LLRVAKLDVIRVKTYVPERDSVWAEVGDRATITFDALPGRAFAGEIARLAGALDPQTRTMLVEIDLQNGDGGIRPGFYGQARLALEKRDGVVALPAAAVRSDGGESFVYVVGANDAARRVNVTLGIAQQGWVEIGGGLSGNERVVTGPVGALADGAAVRVVTP
jgi:RND family efflux transporter MFP subunit